jgi:hypothetical protein
MGTFWNCYQYLWIAAAHEKVGLFAGALRMIGLALETEKMPSTHTQLWHIPATYACKGRVLAAMNQPEEAMVAFERGVELCATLNTFRLVEAVALRDLARYCDVVGNVEKADRVQKQLADSLQQFEGKLTVEQFNQLSFGL